MFFFAVIVTFNITLISPLYCVNLYKSWFRFMRSCRLLSGFPLIRYVFFKGIISLFFLLPFELTVIDLDCFIYVIIKTNRLFFSDNFVFNGVFNFL